MTTTLTPGRVAWLLCSATTSSTFNSLSNLSNSFLEASGDETKPSILLAQAEQEDANGGRLRRVFQRHSQAANSLPGELKALVAIHLAAKATLGYEDTQACKSCLANLLLATHGEELSIVKRLIDFPYSYVLAAAECVDGGAGLSSLPVPQGVEEIDMLALTGLLPLPTQAHFVQHLHSESEATLSKWIVELREKIKKEEINKNSNSKSSGIQPGFVQYRTKIYCDWDDTVRASLFDCSFPRNTVYPGYIAFIRALRGEFDVDVMDMNMNKENDDDNRGKRVLEWNLVDSSTTAVSNGVEEEEEEEEGGGEDKEKIKNMADTLQQTTESSSSSRTKSDVTTTVSSYTIPISTTPATPSTPDRDQIGKVREGNTSVGSGSRGRGAGQLIDTTGLTSTGSVVRSSPSGNGWWDGFFGWSGGGGPHYSPSSTPPRAPRFAPLLSPVPVIVSKTADTSSTSSINTSLSAVMTTVSSSTLSPSASPHSAHLSSTQDHQLSHSGEHVGSGSASPTPSPQIFSPPSSVAWPGRVMRLMERSVAVTKALLHTSTISPSSPSTSSSSVTITGITTLNNIGKLSQADLVFISARPRFLRSQTLKHAQGIGVGHAAILTGTISAALSHDRLAARKLLNYMRHRTLFKEYRTVFIGDSGQADVSAALQILLAYENETKNNKNNCNNSESYFILPPRPLCLIHDIRNSAQEPRTNEVQRAGMLLKGVYFFDSYVDAAYICYEHGLITEKGLSSVISATTSDLSEIQFGTDEQMKTARLKEFQTAVTKYLN
jgi:hypothetical protein